VLQIYSFGLLLGDVKKFLLALAQFKTLYTFVLQLTKN
jgi:hypothetical protein